MWLCLRGSGASYSCKKLGTTITDCLCVCVLLNVCTAAAIFEKNSQSVLHVQLADAQPYNRNKMDPVGDNIGQPDLFPSSEHLAVGKHAMVACDVPLCSEMGTDIIKRGGNAADAAVTVALCIGSVNSHSSGIGGGTYIVSSKSNDSISIDAREAAPRRAHKNMYDQYPLLSVFGGLAVAIPGELDGLYKLHSLHGSGNLSWEQLFEPVIELNRRGWEAPLIWVRALHKINEQLLSRVKVLRESWDFVYKSGTTQLVDTGDWIKRPNLADTLEKIAKNGSAEIFYDPDGPFVPSLLASVNSLGGILEAEDFAAYSAKVTPALRFHFEHGGDNYELLTSGGVSSGLALVAGINFYSALQENDPVDKSRPIQMAHRLIEAMKWTSSARSHLGDTNTSYYDETVDKYTSKKWSQEILEKKLFSDERTFPWQHYDTLYETAGKHGTSHFSVVDNDGGAVAMTTTVNLLFGSSVYDNVTGVFLNDEMDDFSQPHRENSFNLTASALNFVGPFKRPLSSMAPTIIKKNGVITISLGCAGGSRIVTAILQAIVRLIYFDTSLLETISYPRLHHQLLPAFVMVENSTLFNHENHMCVQCGLEWLQHTFVETGALTVLNGIMRVNGVWQGVCDYWRKRGAASGF